jgi:NAD(P)-dependent dehydrogenase (short-subunit alcohol dehydrogenase family)
MQDMAGDNVGRVVLVTGAAAGLGAAIACAFARSGAETLLADIDERRGSRLAGALRAEGHAAHFLVADVADEASVTAAFAEVTERHGRLDVLVNNAGVSPRRPFSELDLEAWRAVLDVNLTSVFLCVRAALPLLRRTGGSSVLNLASLHAEHTVVGLSAYAAAKGGVVSLTRALALELAPDIRVNAIAPGLIETEGWRDAVGGDAAAVESARRARLPYHPLGRLGTPEDVAACALFLSGEPAGFLTGATIPVAGGLGLQLYAAGDVG